MGDDEDNKHVVAVDQGTSSSRAILFRLKDWEVVHKVQREFACIYPQPGWCEQDPKVLLDTVLQCLKGISDYLEGDDEAEEAAGGGKGARKVTVVGVGIANQRETTVAWDRETGEPLHNAIVWLDTRTQKKVDRCVEEDSIDAHQLRTGLPLSTYFSAFKMQWLLENVAAVREARARGTLMMGTVDTWLTWNLTGRTRYVTDVTNASRTMLMNIQSLEWDAELCHYFGVPREILPEIVSSAEVLGPLSCGDLGCSFFPFAKYPPMVAGILGDQQAALVGQHCVAPGMAKNTYGTGCFMLYNVGSVPVYSHHGLLSTVAFQFGKNSDPVYALEGSISVAGEAIRWLVQLGLIDDAEMSEKLASNVDDTEGTFFVPAFNGLLAPHWRPDARGTILGISQSTTREHVCRAALESVALQTREILECMQLDSNLKLKGLLVDGGMTSNRTLLQIQANTLGINVVRPKMAETTALGAALAAALALGHWKLEDFGHREETVETFTPTTSKAQRDARFCSWRRAIEKSFCTSKL